MTFEPTTPHGLRCSLCGNLLLARAESPGLASLRCEIHGERVHIHSKPSGA